MRLFRNNKILLESSASDLNKFFASFLPLAIVLLQSFDYRSLLEIHFRWTFITLANKGRLIFKFFVRHFWDNSSVFIDCLGEHGKDHIKKDFTPDWGIWWSWETSSMGHYDILKSMNVSAPDFSPMIASQALYSLEKDLPN